jgi:hypothetical protein
LLFGKRSPSNHQSGKPSNESITLHFPFRVVHIESPLFFDRLGLEGLGRAAGTSSPMRGTTGFGKFCTRCREPCPVGGGSVDRLRKFHVSRFLATYGGCRGLDVPFASRGAWSMEYQHGMLGAHASAGTVWGNVYLLRPAQQILIGPNAMKSACACQPSSKRHGVCTFFSARRSRSSHAFVTDSRPGES